MRWCSGGQPSLGAQLGVVTRQENVMAYAQELGIPVFRSSKEAQRARWRRPRGLARRLDWRKRGRPYVTPEALREQRAALKAVKVQPLWVRLGAFTLGALSVLALMAFFLPSAKVRLAPALRQQELTLDVWADPNIPVANPSGGLPAREVSVVVEGSEQVPSSGTTRLPGRTADGMVVFTNLTAGSVDIPAETVVVDPGCARGAFCHHASGDAGGRFGQHGAGPGACFDPGQRGKRGARSGAGLGGQHRPVGGSDQP